MPIIVSVCLSCLSPRPTFSEPLPLAEQSSECSGSAVERARAEQSNSLYRLVSRRLEALGLWLVVRRRLEALGPSGRSPSHNLLQAEKQRKLELFQQKVNARLRAVKRATQHEQHIHTQVLQQTGTLLQEQSLGFNRSKQFPLDFILPSLSKVT